MTTNETALRDALAEVFADHGKVNSLAWTEKVAGLLQSPSQPVVAEPHPSLELCVQFSDDGQHIRKWSRLPFDGGECLYSHPQASPPPARGEVAITREMFDFLCGSGPLEGYHFGEANPNERGAFWWRKRLLSLAHSQPDTQEGE